MRYECLKERLAAGDTIILDGPIGTELQRRGARMDPAAWCGPATLETSACWRPSTPTTSPRAQTSLQPILSLHRA